MQEINFLVINKALQLLNDNIVDYILAYKSDLNNYTVSPYLFDNKSKLKNLVFNGFCGANLSKTLFLNSMSINQDKKICVFIKPCDTYSLNQLIKENKLKRQNLYIIGVECNGMLDIDKIKNKVNDVI